MPDLLHPLPKQPEPLATLDPAGKASVLNYQIAAQTAIMTRNFLPVAVPKDGWTNAALAPPPSDPWAALQKPAKVGGTPGTPAKPIRDRVVDHLEHDLGIITAPPLPTEPPPVTDERWDPAYGRLDDAIVQLAYEHRALHPVLDYARNQTIRKAMVEASAKQPAVVGLGGPAVTGVPRSASRAVYADATREMNYRVGIGQVPVVRKSLWGEPVVFYAANPGGVRPTLLIIEEYEVVSFLGDYGAGKTINTFSLLPGEKATISIRTSRADVQTKSKRDNLLDSYSQESADEFEGMVNEELGTSRNDSSAESVGFSSTESWGQSGSVSASAGLNLGIVKVGGGASGAVSHNDTDVNTSTANAARSSAVNAVKKAMDRHVAQSSLARKVEATSETSESSSSTDSSETSSVREIENINRSRVLNFVFRQMSQEYITITYLKDVKIGFTKGFPGDGEEVSLHQLDGLLKRYIRDPYREAVADDILDALASVFDHEGTARSFIEPVTETIPSFRNPAVVKTRRYVRKVRKLSQEYAGKVVPGIILDVSRRILQSENVVVEALLGRGEALDGYNQRLQAAATEKAELANRQLREALTSIDRISDPVQQAQQRAALFNPCCDQRGEGEA